jgi:hypothetical protein
LAGAVELNPSCRLHRQYPLQTPKEPDQELKVRLTQISSPTSLIAKGSVTLQSGVLQWLHAIAIQARRWMLTTDIE